MSIPSLLRLLFEGLLLLRLDRIATPLALASQCLAKMIQQERHRNQSHGEESEDGCAPWNPDVMIQRRDHQGEGTCKATSQESVCSNCACSV